MEFWVLKTLLWAPKRPNQMDPNPQFVLERLIAELELTTGCFWWKKKQMSFCKNKIP